MSEPHEVSGPTNLYRECQLLQGKVEAAYAEIAEWRATQQSLLHSESKRWDTIRELRAQNDRLRELIRRTVVRADNLPLEMIAEFREVLAATENKS